MADGDLNKLAPDQPFEGVKVRDIIRWVGEHKIGLDDTIVTRSDDPLVVWDKFYEVTVGYGIVILDGKRGNH